MDFCNKCNNTGSTSEAGYMDCLAPGCDAATTRAAFDKWLLREGYGFSGIKEWAIYRHAARTETERLQTEVANLAQLHVVSAAAEGAKEQAPFMYAIMGADGKAHFDEHCVDSTEDALYLEVNSLNDSPDTGYTIVPVYLAAPQQHAQAALSADLWEQAYVNMRDWAEQNGLDTKTYSLGHGPLSAPPRAERIVKTLLREWKTGLKSSGAVVMELFHAIGSEPTLPQQAALSDEGCELCDGSGVSKGYAGDMPAHDCPRCASQQPAAAVPLQTYEAMRSARDHYQGLYEQRAAPAIQQEGAALDDVPVDGVCWDLFPSWLIDNCEGNEITEEGLQFALCDLLKSEVHQKAIAKRAALASPAQPQPAAKLSDMAAQPDPEWPAGEREAWKQGRAAGIESAAKVCDILDAEVDKYPAQCAVAIRAINK